MRNDARPVGHVTGRQSPVSRPDSPVHDSEPDSARPLPAADNRASVAHDRQSHIVNREAEAEALERDRDDPVMPTGDSTLKTNI